MNTATTSMRTGARVLIDALAIHGVDTIFGVPGESYLDVLDVLHDHPSGMRFITCRQEGGASYMAEAYGKLTGRPGVCFVTRGPGATNGSIGVHTAQQDSTPMVMFVGQVAREMTDREAFQEVDYRQMFGGLAKWATQIDDPARTPEIVTRAFRTAASGRPGPVVVALPEDMLGEPCSTRDTRPYTVARAHPGPGELDAFRDLLEAAERPLVMMGGGGWNGQACQDAAAFATAHNLPITVSFRCQDYIDNTLPHYAGDVGIGANPRLLERVKAADLLVVIGSRLGEITTQGYTLLRPPVLEQKFVHVHPDPDELGRVYQPDLAINAGGAEFLAAVRGINAVDGSRWADWTAAARADYEATAEPAPAVGPVDMAAIALHLRDTLPKDAVITTGAGNFASWTQRFYRFTTFRSQLSPTNGSMGYGVPAAIAAQAAQPDRVAIAMTGDGDFLMTGQELATAAQYGLKPIVILVNNGMYGTIRMHQEREHPNRTSGTALNNPDFVKLAEAYGAHGELVTETGQFPAALERALHSGTAALIELRVDPDLITTRASLTQIREAALARQKG